MAEKNFSTNSLNEDKIRLKKKNEDKIRFNRLINDQRTTIQCSTIHEGEIYHSNHLRRTSLSIPCQSSLLTSPLSTTTNSFEYSRKKFRSFYRSLIPSKSSTNESNKKSSDNSNRKEISKISSLFPSSPLTSFSSSSSNRKSMRERNYRYSLPDTSTRTFILKNLRQKNRKFPLKLSSPDDSIRSTFQNLLSLVKFPSNNNNKTNSSQSTTNPSTISSLNHFIWNLNIERNEWISSVGIGKIHLSSIELHNLTSIEIECLQKMIFDKFERSSIDLNIPFHLLKDEPIRKRKHHFMFRSKSTEKSKEIKDKDKDKDKETKSNGNIFGIALSECIVENEDYRSDDQRKVLIKTEENLSDRNETIKIIKEKYLSPSASSSSINDSGYSLSPTSLHISDGDYQEKKYRSVSLEALAIQDLSTGINRSNTLRCYPAKVPELIRICCHYIEQFGLQTVGLFRVGVSKKRLKELKDQINTNRTLTFDSSTNVHDVAGLIKEFLRELPEPLLTRHLSLPFIHIRTRIPIEEQNDVLADLIRLLPSSNRDTLYELLKFLHHVSLNSQDRYSSDGKLLSLGNKMDTENLAIVFAPTILLDNKTTKDLSSISINPEQIEQGKDILKLMIDNYKDLFMIQKSLHDQICYSINQIDSEQLNRLLAFKVQNRCGISSMELDDENDEYLKSIDLKCLSMNDILIDNGISSFSILNKNSSNDKREMKQSTTQYRYNFRRNSDFPRSSSHSSRSSEYLQVPLSKSQQRLTTNSSDHHHQQQSKSSLRIRDIREARMDQIIFRLIDPEFISSTHQISNEPIINITSHDEQISSIAGAAASIATAKGTTIASTTNPITIDRITTNDFPLIRQIKSYSRSKTTPLSFLNDAKQYLNAKKYEAKDLCGTSSNESTK